MFPYDESDTNLELWGTPHVVTVGLGPSQMRCWASAGLQQAAHSLLKSFSEHGGMQDKDMKVCK
eukprot:551293-Rhodomonas_salina.1